ncbi:ferredoxin [Trujillonella endophytica]|uniref:Ferredoxin n=1 Tax=Trujillonella endophytica TaxID=673521 RepID=A0A1H8QKU7_9ACTN|nr:ferredoxin [Trujillella endophytica]SEO54849.1 ferredoxin [Trujillella endophytica]
MPEAAPAEAPVRIDRDLCIGAGQCIAYAPQTFVHDDETTAVLREPPHDAEADVAAAVEACPMGALTLRSSVPTE